MTPKGLIARRLLGVEMSGIRKMFELANKGAVNMGLGEPDFEPAPHIQEALREAVASGKNHYGPTLGLPQLRAAIAHRIKDYRGEKVSAENIIVTAGATQALMTLNHTFVDHGDEILYPDPGFVLYPSQARICGGFPIPYSLTPENKYQPDVDEIQAKITPRTKLIMVNTPSNPTGACMDKKAVKAICEIAEDKGVMIVADEVYDFLSYDGEHNSFLAHHDNVIWVNSFSKTYALTGWRLGCIATKREYVKSIETMHYYTVACPPTPFQWAAVAALEGPQDQAEHMLETFRKRRDKIYGRLRKMRGFHMVKPGGAFYAFPRYDFDIPSQDLALGLAKKGLISVPGSAFGALGEGHLRFSYAVSLAKIDEGMDLLEEFAEDLPLKN